LIDNADGVRRCTGCVDSDRSYDGVRLRHLTADDARLGDVTPVDDAAQMIVCYSDWTSNWISSQQPDDSTLSQTQLIDVTTLRVSRDKELALKQICSSYTG